MLHPTNRHDPADLRVGDLARFPLSFQEPDAVYRHSFELVSFGAGGSSHLVVVRRLADGFTATVTIRRFLDYALDERRRSLPDIAGRLARLHAVHRAQEMKARTDGWRERPCFYATVRKGQDWRPLAGPFATHAAARDALPQARRLANQRDARAPWYAYGTALLPDGALTGLFSAEIGDAESNSQPLAA